MKLNSILILILVGAGATGCVTTFQRKPGVVEKPYTKFGVQLPSSGWQQRQFRDVDIFLEHKASTASIIVSSQCEGLKDSPLEALRAQLLLGFENVEITHEERLALSQREALVSDISAKIDGVPRFLKVVVLRKNRCVYDAILSSPTNIPEITKDFDQMIATFWAEAEL